LRRGQVKTFAATHVASVGWLTLNDQVQQVSQPSDDDAFYFGIFGGMKAGDYFRFADV